LYITRCHHPTAIHTAEWHHARIELCGEGNKEELMNAGSPLLAITHPDPHVRRRGHLLAIIALIMLGLSALCLPIVIFFGDSLTGLPIVGGSILVYGITLYLVRQGRIMLGGWLTTACVMIGVTVSVFDAGANDAAASLIGLPFLSIGVALITLATRPMNAWWSLAIALAILTAVALLHPAHPLANPALITTIAINAIVVIGIACLSYFGAATTNQALRATEANAGQATHAQARAEAQARELELQTAALEEAEQRQRDLVATLETPTVVIADGVLLAPIIGIIDSRRAQRVTTRLLDDITAQRVRSLIMDISGVSLIDTGVAQALVHTIQAVRLLGCEVTITGISATVAATITQLGIDLDSVRIARSPQDVLAQYAVLGTRGK
jgi:anti-anti-sigma regulatory factor